MRAPGCPEHGNLVLELVRGQLDDPRVEKAESVRSECAVCARWWEDALGVEEVAVLDHAVAEVFQGFVSPRQNKIGWLAVVAVMVVTVGFGTTVLLWHNTEIPSSITEPSPTEGTALSTWDFEDANLEAFAAPDAGDQVVFESGFESGNISSWSIHG